MTATPATASSKSEPSRAIDRVVPAPRRGPPEPVRPEAARARPESSEYSSSFAPYVEAVGKHDPFVLLWGQVESLRAIAQGISAAAALYRYSEGKWSVKETFGHLSDAERMVSHWLFRVSRGDETPLRSFDRTSYVTVARYDERSISDLVDEFECIRLATLRLIASSPFDAWSKRGVVESDSVSARALLYTLPGHVEHHLELLRTRYEIAVPSIELRYGPAGA